MSLTEFTSALKTFASRVPEAQLVIVMGTDGIAIERLALGPDANLDAVAAEYTTLLRASLQAARDTGLGELLEIAVVAERMTALIRGISGDYYLFAALTPGALIGRARFALRLASLALEREFA